MSVVGPFYCHSRYFCTVLILIDSKYVITGTGDNAVKVWDVELKKMVGKSFQGHNNLHWFKLCSFSHNGTHAILCSGGQSVEVCDVKTNQTIVGPFCGHLQEDVMNSVSFSNDNKHILSCLFDWTNRIWDSEAGENV